MDSFNSLIKKENDQSVLSLLVISSFQYNKILIEALINENLLRGNGYNLLINSCQSVEEVTSFRTSNTEATVKTFLFDYVIFLVDVVLREGLLKAEKEIRLIPNYYLTTRRIFFISSSTSNVDCGFWNLRWKYKCPVVVGDILEPKGSKSIAKRVLNLIEFSTGMNTGFPFFGID